ncbi:MULTISPECIES: chalcone isomerase family protein [unclassified Pseudomonas]|uniref:chalcone isomerase family protein n=1 Tax=unclassified Pseudomonas TaxID=196821 RepID=UPI0008F1F91F|nr:MULTISPECIES: chalcone isomerase family protein [unclassified Pseudomonas]SFI49959.1 Chalcone isomerase-like [Pseudomonas sp. NFPP04]SFJ56874.1 Chalcone isomerase-like [Pseudomonas sp. NFPP11]
MRHLVFGLMLMLSISAQANEPNRLRQADFPAHSQALVLKNQTVLTYLWADVYAAALYAPPDLNAKQAWDQQAALRLTLYYFRDIDRNDVIKAANTTLARQHISDRLKSEVDKLHAVFRNIHSGDRYALDFRPGRGLDLEINGEVLFSSSDNELAKAYLGVWLAPKGLSERLLE